MLNIVHGSAANHRSGFTREMWTIAATRPVRAFAAVALQECFVVPTIVF